MGILICEICNEHLPLCAEAYDSHVCDPNKIEAHVKRLRNEKTEAEHRLSDIKDAVFKVIKDLPSLEGETVTVKTEWLRKLWDSANCRWYDAKTADSFLSEWLSTHMILCEAFDLFESKGSLLQRLQKLREACDNANERLNYNAKFDLSPEDIINDT